MTGPAGYGPAQIIGAYGIVGDGAGQTIAVTDAGDYAGFVNSTDPNFDSSALHIFDQQFGLPDPPSFTKYNMFGQTSPLPAPDEAWFLEIALDVEWSHAIAPAANIELVEASESSLNDLSHASNTAAMVLNASVVSQSWGLLEYRVGSALTNSSSKTRISRRLSPPIPTSRSWRRRATAAQIWADLPLISPLIVGVGGTSLFITGDTFNNETAWSGGGGGPSNVFPLPSYQQGVSAFNFGPLSVRSVPISPPSPIPRPVSRCTNRNCTAVGFRSVAPAWPRPLCPARSGSPTRPARPSAAIPWAAPARLLPALYAAYDSPDYTSDFRDITSGFNGFDAGPGYDLATGIGTEQARNLLPYLSLVDLGPAVVSSDPAAGQVVTTTPPTTFSLTFSEPIVPELDRRQRL